MSWQGAHAITPATSRGHEDVLIAEGGGNSGDERLVRAVSRSGGEGGSPWVELRAMPMCSIWPASWSLVTL